MGAGVFVFDESDLRYTPSDCFQTFPFPEGFESDSKLEAAGRAYHDHRAELMIARNEGMTPTYNRFHKADCNDPQIAHLRDLRQAMDRAVLAAYGWADLAAEAEAIHLDDRNETEFVYQKRLFWPAAFRDKLLARLLDLNRERAAAETAGAARAAMAAPKRRGQLRLKLADAPQIDMDLGD